METAGEWLEKALIDLCKKIETGLDLDAEIISALVSYCELVHPLDAKEYLDNIIGQEAGKVVTEEYLRRRGHLVLCTGNAAIPASKLQAYVKPPSGEISVSGTKKPFKTPKEAAGSSYRAEPKKNVISGNQENRIPNDASDSRNMRKGNQGNSKKKKAGKVVSLAEAAKGSIVFHQGKPCSCQARQHRLVSNCLSCGKIVCEQEGEGPCNFCGALVLREGSTYAGLEGSFTPVSDAEAAAEAYAKRLVEYDRNAKKKSDARDNVYSSFDEAATLLAENIKAVGDQISRSIASEVVIQQKSEEHQKMEEKASNLYSALWSIEGLTDDQRYDALSKIPDHPTQMIVFFSLPSVARLEWVRRFLSHH
ncbi:hypothetical protein ES319_D03G111700v1 [Gossypium barbadense]|uniref:TRIP4/RQT4 C2HC5-type zinc finger domain-containing protein n=1 Tax=Gossypium barbadense TaxID=3634 RepID=A0A5J5S3S7_GOSBA|nr:hypothetical protein ES319_D03G111700v1 [Gossypium barbadense]